MSRAVRPVVDSGDHLEHPPAIVAPAETKRLVPRSYFSTYAGFGVGVGNHGPAGSYFFLADVFPLEHWGFGFEAVRAGSTSLRILERNSTAKQNALRGRLAFRWLTGPRGALSASFAAGSGTYDYDPSVYCDEIEMSDWHCQLGRGGGEGTALSFGGQLGAHGRYGRVAFGFVLRADFVGSEPVAHVTLGPTLGFEI